MKNVLFFFLFFATSFIAQTQTLRLILVSDYGDKDFGLVSMAGEEMIGNMFRSVSARIDYEFQPIYVNKTQAEGFTKEAVLNAINKPTQPNDIVVFYYSGFGSYPTKSLYPSLNLNASLALDDIANILQKKGIKLGLLMADCRNEFTDVFPIAGQRNTIVKEDRSKSIAKKIFLEGPCRILKMASARKGYKAFSFKRNSVFTYSLTEAFEDMLYVEDLKDVSLDILVGNVENLTKGFMPEYKGLSKETRKCKN